MDAPKKSLVIGCVDDRVQVPLNRLCQQIGAEDGVEPYRHTAFGSSLPYVSERTRTGFLWHARAALPAVHRIVIVDHDGGENEPGCLAYQIEYSSDPAVPLDATEEDMHHRANLVTAERVFRSALRAHQRGPGDVVIQLYIDHHDTGLQAVYLPRVATLEDAHHTS